ncbi:MAG TPA: tRNA (adenosine(37)-N6)-dimethylallyltransferase MiaA [Candidatus Binatia bacterium]|nr:tRNA (adenosine(37)-N6)-dimethylallyltransferase MiaA [Candidatus Binatia bacterium]
MAPRGAASPVTPILAVVGPTATGKTALAVRLARRLGAAELVNADSRQVLRGLRVGTNVPDPGQLLGVPCHLLELVDPGSAFSVADWLRAARACLADLELRGVRPILVGGTGLYLRALMEGFELDGEPPPPGRRAALDAGAASPEGLAELARELTRLDPGGAAGVDLRNPRRVVRALEIVDRHGSLEAGRRRGGTLPGTLIGLDAEPALHRRWILERARSMMAGGLVEETAAALRRGISATALAAAGIGYQEALAVLAGRMDREQAVAGIARRTHRYARAQRTWFRAEPRLVWLRRRAEGDLDGVIEQAMELIAA